MSYAVVFSSRTGNTELLAKAIREELGAEGCVYFGVPDAAALAADTLYVGFWTDKGTCDETIAAFLQGLAGKRVFLFGTAGFGGARAYFDQILASAAKNLPEGAVEIGRFMCQGKCRRWSGSGMRPWRRALAGRPCWKISTKPAAIPTRQIWSVPVLLWQWRGKKRHGFRRAFFMCFMGLLPGKGG